MKDEGKSHNPCFSGISFAIKFIAAYEVSDLGHNPCFSGISFAMRDALSHTLSM